jgi:hypothetical protein
MSGCIREYEILRSGCAVWSLVDKSFDIIIRCSLHRRSILPHGEDMTWNISQNSIIRHLILAILFYSTA